MELGTLYIVAGSVRRAINRFLPRSASNGGHLKDCTARWWTILAATVAFRYQPASSPLQQWVTQLLLPQKGKELGAACEPSFSSAIHASADFLCKAAEFAGSYGPPKTPGRPFAEMIHENGCAI